MTCVFSLKIEKDDDDDDNITDGRTSFSKYLMLIIEIKEYNVLIDGKNFFSHFSKPLL